MKILGITAEYNPFHNGHKYHMEESKKITGADCTVVVMSGNFTQRGETALLDKWTRSRMAVDQGADLVLELPFIFACNRAEMFARGAMDILAGIDADFISFGSESGSLGELSRLAADMVLHREEIELLKADLMDKGNSYVKSMHMASEQVLGKKRASLMLEPNNILALEYLKRLRIMEQEGHAPEAVTVKRYGSGYFDADKDNGFAGASVIRRMVREGNTSAPDIQEEIRGYVPEEFVYTIAEAGSIKNAEERALQILRSEIVIKSSEELSKIYCIGEGLENKLKKEIVRAESLSELISSMVSRRYTEAAVRRMLTYILMGIKEREPEQNIYARLLAAGERGRSLLKKLKKSSKAAIPIITNVNKDGDIYASVYETLKYDLLASDMYNILMGRNLYRYSDKVLRPYMKDIQ